MTLSNHIRNGAFEFDSTPGTIGQRSRKMVRLATVCVAVSLASIDGIIATDAEAHHDEPCFPVNQNTRSILLIEGKEAPGGALAGDVTPGFALTANGRSIALIESKEAPVATADADALPDFVVDQNRRSILLIEGLQTPNAVVADDAVPAFAVDQNTRSIALIEGRDPANGPAESAASGEAAG